MSKKVKLTKQEKYLLRQAQREKILNNAKEVSILTLLIAGSVNAFEGALLGFIIRFLLNLFGIILPVNLVIVFALLGLGNTVLNFLYMQWIRLVDYIQTKKKNK